MCKKDLASYEKKGRIEDAIADFERALELDGSFGFLKDRISQLITQLEAKK